MKNQTEIINVEYGEDNCPADALMSDFRKRAKETSAYQKNIEFSENCIKFFREMADIVEESDDNVKFGWNAIPENDLPPLIVKIRKDKGKYKLQYLKELGEEKAIIKGKQRKGKNKNGKLKIEKEGEER